MKKFFTLFSAYLLVLFFACQNEPKSEEAKNAPAPQATEETTSKSGLAPLEKSDVQLICVPADDPNQESGYPQNEVFLYLAESKVKVADILACETIEPNQYADHQIPDEAIAAVGGWWAGSGDYVYVVEEKGNFVVKKGQVFEEQEDNSYHYKTVMTFTKEGEEVF